jgi:hypothetical protein
MLTSQRYRRTFRRVLKTRLSGKQIEGQKQKTLKQHGFLCSVFAAMDAYVLYLQIHD